MSIKQDLEVYLKIIGENSAKKSINTLKKEAKELQDQLKVGVNDPKYKSKKFGQDMVRSSAMQKYIAGRERLVDPGRYEDFREHRKNVYDGKRAFEARRNSRAYHAQSGRREAMDEDAVVGRAIRDRQARRNKIRIDAIKGRNEAIHELNQEQAKKEAALYKRLTKQRVKEYDTIRKRRQRDGKEGIREAKKELAKQKRLMKEKTAMVKKETEKQSKFIKDSFATGFSMHIMSMYALPAVMGLQRIMENTLQTFGDFDKKFVDYTVKSEEYFSSLSRKDFYSLAAGQTYGLSEAAVAAERFAASGIDVTQSQEALDAALQTATVSGLDFNEAANGIIRTMQAMHMEVQNTAEITDAMINSANASTAELEDLVGWFEYSAAAAYNAGLNVQELSSMLGVLSSTGLPNTGTAIRQMFLQLSKKDVQENFKERFDWISDESFRDVNSLIEDLREYVQTSEDQKAVTLEITRLIGGKVTAQQAVNNLLMAEPELWDQVTSAVQRSGTTQSMYNKMTDNAADALKRIQNSLSIIATQLGQFLAPTLAVVDKTLATMVKVFNNIPSVVKSVGGVVLFFAGAVATAGMVILALVGSMAIMQGAIKMLQTNQIQLSISTNAYRNTLVALCREIMISTGLKQRQVLTNDMIIRGNQTIAASNATVARSYKGLGTAIGALSGAMIGYMGMTSAARKDMITEARMIATLTSLWVAYHSAKYGGPVGALVGGAGTFTLLQSRISQIERENDLAQLRTAYNLKGYGGTTNNYNMNIGTANIDDGGMTLDELGMATKSGLT